MFCRFSTDALGDVITVGRWYGGYSSAIVITSWAGDLNGGWWNNGANEVVCTASAADCVWAADVSENLIGSSWTASEVSSVPEPTNIVLLGLGFQEKRKIPELLKFSES